METKVKVSEVLLSCSEKEYINCKIDSQKEINGNVMILEDKYHHVLTPLSLEKLTKV